MEFNIKKITEAQLSDLMLKESAKEGWLYSQQDVSFYLNFPRNQIYAIKVNNELAGCLIRVDSISYLQNLQVRSAGLFLVKEKFRSNKVGSYLWDHVFTKEINENSLVCFHSVPRVAQYYHSMGYKKTTLATLVYKSKNTQPDDFSIIPNIKKISSSDFSDIEKYNQDLFPRSSGVGFCEFIQAWIKRPDALTFVYYDNGAVQGYGIATSCQNKNYRISPLYANSNEIACEILKAMLHFLKNNTLYLFSTANSKTTFGTQLNELGFAEIGNNFVVCNRPELINENLTFLKKVFCSIPLEFPPEIVSS